MSLPDWSEPLPDAEATRDIDRWAIETRGVPSLDLMERAGTAVARAAERLAPDGEILILCGKGNNGGDGLLAGRLLREAGRSVRILITADPAELRGDARESLERLPGEPPETFAAGPLDGALILDALLGTGFSGEPHGPVRAAIEAIEAVRGRAGGGRAGGRAGEPRVLSIDVPSGLDSSTGAVAGPAVHADRTVTFNAPKPGLWINPGKSHAGTVEVADIGIPRGAPMRADIGLMGPRLLDILPRRGSASTKFISGHLLLVGGSRGLIGAPCMAATAAIRTGAGYLTACVARSLQDLFAARMPLEVMTRGLPDRDGSLTLEARDEILELGARGGALALGPGLGRSEEAFELARTLARRAELPIVIDADGLNAHAGRLEDLRERPGPTVLTPHAGELGRLLELSSAEIEAERLRHVRDAARRAASVVLLKGDDTLIAEPGGIVIVSPGGSPALATAGTGDVLTGIIGALLAQGLGALEAASAGAALHAQAGRLAAAHRGVPEGVIATDVIEQISHARPRREPT